MSKKLYKLKGVRVSHNKTQKQMAEVLKMAETSYTKRENGDIDITRNEIIAIAKEFHLSPNQIIEIFFDEPVDLKETYEVAI